VYFPLRRRFIILGDSPGMGDSKDSEYLVLTLKETKTHYVRLDQQEGFEQNIQIGLINLIIVELFFGDSNTAKTVVKEI
jgi:hypothetical protein